MCVSILISYICVSHTYIYVYEVRLIPPGFKVSFCSKGMVILLQPLVYFCPRPLTFEESTGLIFREKSLEACKSLS